MPFRPSHEQSSGLSGIPVNSSKVRPRVVASAVRGAAVLGCDLDAPVGVAGGVLPVIANKRATAIVHRLGQTPGMIGQVYGLPKIRSKIGSTRREGVALKGKLAICCADIGAVHSGNFGWARVAPGTPDLKCGDIDNLVEEACRILAGGMKLALGFECPLWIPLRDDPILFTRARVGEGSAAWSSSIGATVLTIGLAETVWVLSEVRVRLLSSSHSVPPVYLDWGAFANADEGLFLWEALVTGKDKTGTHEGDALAACHGFKAALPDPAGKVAVKSTGDALSLVGTVALRAGWSRDLGLLETPCLVVKP